jgi:microcystin-dependent protein
MSDQFVAEIRMFGCNFAPTGWALCNGQLLPISQNTALFSLLGTTYGGDGKSTFGLPDLQGAAPMHFGEGQGLSPRYEGEQSGEPFVTLILSEMPAHTHTANGSTGFSNSNDPATRVMAKPFGGGFLYDPGASNLVQMAFESIQPAGGSLPHNNIQPSLVMNFCIALQGIFPPRT